MSSVKSVYIMTSRLLAQREELAMTANNVANVNTDGYKKIEMDFKSVLAEKSGEDVGIFAEKRPLRLDLAAGALNKTNNPFDFALQGDGFFAVDTGGGNISYTRSGHFMLDGEGNLISADGAQLLDTNNAPINIPLDAKNVNVTRDGVVATDQGLLAEIGVFSFEDTTGMKNIGSGRYVSGGQEPLLVEGPTVLQGMLEASNVNPIEETVALTELARSYQSASRLIRTLEDVEGRAVRELARMPS